MDRVRPGGFAALIEAATSAMPAGIRDLVRPHFLCGVDPVFAGLHEYGDASYGRSYREIAHVAYPVHQYGRPRADRRTTVVLPRLVKVEACIHELGHVLDERLGFQHCAQPVTWYAEDNRAEAFAEAFASWVLPGYAHRPDEATLALFESLAA